MNLSHLDHGVVFEVVREAIDLHQVYALHGHKNPFVVTNKIMGTANFAWVAWHKGRPQTVFGASPVANGVWQMYLMTRPGFENIVLPMTRFLRRTVLPTLFNDIGAHRLECLLHQDNHLVHKWVEAFGARQEFIKEHYAADGAAYFGFVRHRESRDIRHSTNPPKSPTIPTADVVPGLAAPEPLNDTTANVPRQRPAPR